MGKVATSPLPSRGSPPLQSWGGNQKWPTCGQSGYVTPAVSGIPTASQRGEKSEVAHKWAKWLRHPCRLGDPHRFRAGGEIRSGPLVGKVATSPLPSRGSPPLQSGGENQKWPTSGQSGYVTPAVSGIPSAAERGGKSEVAHKWAKWLRHPCRLGDPHRCKAGGKSQVAHLWAKWLRHPCRLGGPDCFRAGAKSEVAHLWAKWLRHPCRLGDPHRCTAGGEIRSGPLVGKGATSPLPSRGSPPLQSGGGESEVAHKWAKWLRHPCRLGDPHRFRAGGEIRSGPLVGKVATSPLPSRGSPPLQSGGENQKWPTSGQSGYVTPAISGIPSAAERGGKSEVAHKWAKWLRHPCRLGDPHRCRAGGKSQVAHLWAKWLRHPCRLGDPHRCTAGGEIRSGPLVGKGATSPLPSRGSPPLQSGGGKSEVAHLWAKWLRHPCRLGDPHRFRAGGEIRSGPQMGKVATSPLPSRGSPPLQSGGGNQKWPTCGQSGYVTPAASGIPTAAQRGGKSEVAHKWAKWLHHPAVSGIPTALQRGGEIRSGPQVGKVATSPLPSRGSPPLHSWGGNQKWPTCGQSGYVTPAVSGIPTASERGVKSEVAHKWAKWLRHPCRLGDPHRFRAGGEIRSGPLVGKVATSPLPSRGSPPLHSGGKNQKWPTSGQSGYVTPAVSGIPTASELGGKSEVAHLWAKWLRHPCRLGDPHRFRAGGKIRSGQQVGKVATSPLPSRGSQVLQSGGGNQRWPTSGQSGYVTPAVSGIPTAAERGENHKWPTCGQSGYVTPAVSGAPTASERGQNQKWPTCGQSGCVTPAVSGIPTAAQRGEKSEVAHLWAKGLRHPCRLGDPHRCRAGGGNQKWPTCGQSGYVTPAVSGIPTASERGGKSEVAHKWAKWLRHPCRLGDPHRFTAGGKIRSGPQVGKVATSPLPSRGSPPLQSWEGNQKWPTCGQSGYVTPAVSGIPTASERGGKSEVANKWAKWLRHPCRLGDPKCCRAGGEIRGGPQVGKVATSPLPSRGSPPLQSGGGNQKWPTSGQSGYITQPSRGSPPLHSGGGN